MNAATFDTHAAVTALRDAGLDEAPAGAIGVVIANATLTDVFVFGALRLLQP